MSIWDTVKGAVGGAVTGFITGGVPGAVVGAGVGGVGASMGSSSKLPPLPGGARQNTVGPVGKIAPIAAGVGGALAAGGRKIAGIARGASAMCAKYPAWCLAAGGLGAVAGLMQSGQLPVPKRRRRRGITPRDLSSFRRVANLVNHYAKPVHHMRNTKAPRGKTCR